MRERERDGESEKDGEKGGTRICQRQLKSEAFAFTFSMSCHQQSSISLNKSKEFKTRKKVKNAALKKRNLGSNTFLPFRKKI